MDHRDKPGETLVEVVLSLAILSVVLLSSYILTNRATRITKAASEKTQASNLVQTQAELLRAWSTADKTFTPEVNLSDPNQLWDQITANQVTLYDATTQPQINCSYDVNSDLTITSTTNSSIFYFDNASTILSPSAPTKIQTDLPYYVWVEAYSEPANTDYIDFHIFACWERLGGGIVDRTGAITRINL